MFNDAKAATVDLTLKFRYSPEVFLDAVNAVYKIAGAETLGRHTIWCWIGLLWFHHVWRNTHLKPWTTIFHMPMHVVFLDSVVTKTWFKWYRMHQRGLRPGLSGNQVAGSSPFQGHKNSFAASGPSALIVCHVVFRLWKMWWLKISNPETIRWGTVKYARSI